MLVRRSSRVLFLCGLSLAVLLTRDSGAAPGDPDPSFGEDGSLTTPFGESQSTAYALVLQPDGKVVAAGYSTTYTGLPPYYSSYAFALARYDSTGTLDEEFGTGGLVTLPAANFPSEARALVLQPDGKLVAAGSSYGTDQDFAVVRYLSDGSLDDGFGTRGQATTPVGTSSDAARALVLQPDGKLVAAGYSDVSESSQFALVRHDPDGGLDGTFDRDGKVTTPIGDAAEAQALVLQPDGKLVAAGFAQHYTGQPPFYSASAFALARYNPDGSLDPDFGDGGIVTTPMKGGESATPANRDCGHR